MRHWNPFFVLFAMIYIVTLSGCDSSTGDYFELYRTLKHTLYNFRTADVSNSGIEVPGSAAGFYRPTYNEPIVAADGLANIENLQPLHEDSLFRIGSQTKTFAAALIFQLEQEEKLSINDAISNYLDYPGGDGITIRHLLGHTSGVVSITDERLRSDLDQLVEEYPFPEPEQLIQMCADSNLSDFEPGTRFAYSNTGYLMLGLIAEQVEGIPWHEQIRERFLEPLQMTSTYLYGYEGGPEPITGYSVCCADQDGATETTCSQKTVCEVTPGADATFSWSTGGIISTAKDMAIWFHALVAGDLLGEEQRNKMQTLTWQSQQWAEETFSDGSTEGLGLGLFKYNVTGVGEAWGHSGRISGFGNIGACFKEDEFTISNLNNMTEADTAASLKALAHMMSE